MSLVSDFAESAFSQASAMIGKEVVAINGTNVYCVLSEITYGNEFSEGGYENQITLSAVCLSDDIPSGVILKKTATTRGITFRIDSVSKGYSFTTLRMTQVEKG